MVQEARIGLEADSSTPEDRLTKPIIRNSPIITGVILLTIKWVIKSV